MNCLFCKCDSDKSISVEHILPESLGNKEHILPKGVVCDDCNNYFATKIEKVLLDQPYFRSVRHRCGIESKKGNVPFEKGFQLSPFPTPIDIYIENGQRSIVFIDETAIQKFLNAKSGAFVIPIISEPEKNDPIVSRFLAKVSVEALINWIKEETEWIEEIMNKPELEHIKHYARYGSGTKLWPYHQRRLYHEEELFVNPEVLAEPYEILHEFKFFWTKGQEFYFILAIMGIEYAINMGGPSIESYQEWLIENGGRSILTSDDERKVKKKT
jgi:hypothetical protein